MSIDIQAVPILQRDAGHVLVLSETPQLDSIHMLYEAALNLSQTATQVTVECHGVEHLGAWALQILLALQIALAGSGGTLRITGASPQIRHYLTLAGLSERFCDESAGGNTWPKQC